MVDPLVKSLLVALEKTVMNAKHIEGGVPVSRSRIMWLIPSTCYTQNLACSDSSQNIPLVNARASQNVDGYLEIKGPSFSMLSIHMWKRLIETLQIFMYPEKGSTCYIQSCTLWPLQELSAQLYITCTTFLSRHQHETSCLQNYDVTLQTLA